MRYTASGVSMPVIARSVVDFPEPFAPRRVTTSPVAHCERDVPQRVDGAVNNVHILERQHTSSAAAKIGPDDFGFF